jgi:hypothetical protein
MESQRGEKKGQKIGLRHIEKTFIDLLMDSLVLGVVHVGQFYLYLRSFLLRQFLYPKKILN